MANRRILTTNEYQLRVRQAVDALKARLRQSPYLAPQDEQHKILMYFAKRAIQIGEACFRIDNLEVPLFVLARVLCEDLFLAFWVSQSATNAANYSKRANSEAIRMLRTTITNKRAKIRHKKTGKDVTASFLPELTPLIHKRENIEDVARDCGLEKVYDVVYRHGSLEVHGNTFGLSGRGSANSAVVAISAINAFLKVIWQLIDARTTPLTSVEVLQILNMGSAPGG